MLFGRRHPEPDAGEPRKRASLATIRDLVEIFAIVAAGIWASYTFIYENQIKPTLSPPEMQFESAMNRLGTHNGLIAVQLHGSIANIGKTEVWLYGIAESVVGFTIRSRRHPVHVSVAADAVSLQLEPDWETDRGTQVFGTAFLTHLANPKSRAGFNLSPGQSVPFDRVFYVTAHRFDQLRCTVAIRYAGKPLPIPFALHESKGIISIEQRSDDDVYLINEQSSVLALW